MTTPERLRSLVARDMKPARPLRSPVVRALAIGPLAMATVVIVPLVTFFRSDMAELGLLRGWGLSFVESLAGIVVVGLALRESIPGRALSRGSLLAAFIIGLAVPFGIMALTATPFSAGPSQFAWTDTVVCLRTSFAAAIPLMLLATLLVARALPLRPGVAGALYGLGCGLVADAGLRLYCEFTVPSHFLTAHAGAVVVALGAGAAIGAVIQRS
ncbi:MAG TPA: NrsF family protein [Vicinamibacterales bacterium]